VTIADNDGIPLPSVTIAATTPTASEHGAVPGVFTITRTGDLSQALTVTYAIDASSTATQADYTQTLTGTAVIAANQASTTITVTPIDDGVNEPDETLKLNLVGDPAHYTLGASTSATVTILDSTLATVTGVSENTATGLGYAGRSLSTMTIDPSGIGVWTISIAFSEAVAFNASSVVVQRVTLSDDGLTETPGTPMTLTLSSSATPGTANTIWGAGTTTMTISLGKAAVVDTWVKVTVLAGGVSDLQGHALDGDAKTLGNVYITGPTDLPTGNGTPGGNSVFYVGSLRGDYWTSSRIQTPDGKITATDVNGFVAAYQAGSLTADYWTSSRIQTPDGVVTSTDVNGFVAAYQAALAANLHLGKLPSATGGGGALMALQSDTASSNVSTDTSSGSSTSGSSGTALASAGLATSTSLASSDTSDALGVAAPVAYVAPASSGTQVVTTTSASVAQVSGAATNGSSTDASLTADGGLVDALATASSL
jgi:hypothetical protein